MKLFFLLVLTTLWSVNCQDTIEFDHFFIRYLRLFNEILKTKSAASNFKNVKSLVETNNFRPNVAENVEKNAQPLVYWFPRIGRDQSSLRSMRRFATMRI